MDSLQTVGCFFLFPFLLLVSYKLISGYKIGHNKNLPPSPPSLPIIGHFHLLKAPIFDALNTLSRRYGPVLFLRFGQRPVLLLSTPSAIEECLTKNDIVFSNRPRFPSRKQLDYNFTSIGGAPYGHLWRNLRRFAVLEIFSSKRLQMSSSIRMEEIRFLTTQLFKSSTKGVDKVGIRLLFDILTYNVAIKMLTGNRYFEDPDLINSDETRHRLDDIKQIFSPSGKMSLGDYFPSLRWLFAFREVKQMMILFTKRDSFLKELIDARRNSNIRKSSSIVHGEKRQIILDTMLSLQELEPEFYTDDIMKGVVLVIIKIENP